MNRRNFSTTVLYLEDCGGRCLVSWCARRYRLSWACFQGMLPPKRRIANLQRLIQLDVMAAFSRTRHVVRVAAAVAVLFAWSVTACRMSPDGSVGDSLDQLVPELEPVPSCI